MDLVGWKGVCVEVSISSAIFEEGWEESELKVERGVFEGLVGDEVDFFIFF